MSTRAISVVLSLITAPYLFVEKPRDTVRSIVDHLCGDVDVAPAGLFVVGVLVVVDVPVDVNLLFTFLEELRIVIEADLISTIFCGKGI